MPSFGRSSGTGHGSYGHGYSGGSGGSASSSDTPSAIGNVFSFLFGIPIAIITGLFYGVFVAFQLLGGLFAHLFDTPLLGPAIVGVFIGVSVAWVKRAFKLKRQRSEPLISALFSTRIAHSDPAGFALHLVLHAATGYLVFFAFAHHGFLSGGTATHYAPTLRDVAVVIAGAGGPSGGFGGGFLDFLFVLIVLVVAGGLLGGSVGAILLAPLSTLNWAFYVGPALQGATASVTYTILTNNVTQTGRPSFKEYFWESAWHGACEGALVGVVIGGISTIVHLAP
jgi:hypothetical protein